MKKTYLRSIVCAAMLFFASCDSFVDVKPEYSLDADNYFNDPDDYDKALTAAYDLLQTSYLDIWLGEIASDNAIAGGESVTDTEGLHQIDAMTHGGVNTELQSLFRFMYAGIARVNYIFEFKDKISFDGKNQIIAQASFLRAYYYFTLVKNFGDVPLLLDKRFATSEIGSISRTPFSEVYAQIEKDLKSAAASLPWSQPVKGRITKGAALSLLGKVYLYQKKYDECKVVLDEVINKKIYSLFNDYSTLFHAANESSPETVFDIQYVGSEGGGYDCFVCLEGFLAVGFHGIRGYSGPIYADGNSYNLPTQDLYDAFDPADSRRDATVLDIEAFRKNQSETVLYKEGLGGHTGYYNNKYIKRANELGENDNDLTSPVNHKVIRYADVLLMAAEAHHLSSSPDDDLAKKYLNEVRSRPGVEMPEVIANGEDLTVAIYNERRWELSGEGLRFYDLVRTGRAAEEIEGFTENKNELFPIPQVEIDLAGAGWTQNPGY